MNVKSEVPDCEEQTRIKEARESQVPWRKWGPYLSERQWGTVREDYSEDGNAWDYVPHEQAQGRVVKSLLAPNGAHAVNVRDCKCL